MMDNWNFPIDREVAGCNYKKLFIEKVSPRIGFSLIHSGISTPWRGFGFKPGSRRGWVTGTSGVISSTQI